MENLTLLKVVISTLNSVEVKGKDNLDRLLGCINALESLVQITEEAQNVPSTTDESKIQEVSNGR